METGPKILMVMENWMNTEATIINDIIIKLMDIDSLAFFLDLPSEKLYNISDERGC